LKVVENYQGTYRRWCFIAIEDDDDAETAVEEAIGALLAALLLLTCARAARAPRLCCVTAAVADAVQNLSVAFMVMKRV